MSRAHAAFAVAFSSAILVPRLAVAEKSGTTSVESETILLDEAEHERPFRIDAVAGITSAWVGGGVWFSIPLLHDGFIPGVNDALDLEPGGYLIYQWVGCSVARRCGPDPHGALVPLIGPRWLFHFTDEWSAFLAIKLGAKLAFAGFEGNSGFASQGSIGAYWQFSEAVALRFELGGGGATAGWGWGVFLVGVSFPITTDG